MDDPTVQVRQLVRDITQAVARRTGRVGPDVVRAITEEVVGALGLGGPPSPEAVDAAQASRAGSRLFVDPRLAQCLGCEQDHQSARQDRVILTCTGRNRKGIVARLTAVIDECGGDIRDISQTIVSDYFTMIIVVDVAGAACDYVTLKQRLEETAHAESVDVMLVRDRALQAMQRI